jgi:hypothetical protein
MAFIYLAHKIKPHSLRMVCLLIICCAEAWERPQKIPAKFDHKVFAMVT